MLRAAGESRRSASADMPAARYAAMLSSWRLGTVVGRARPQRSSGRPFMHWLLAGRAEGERNGRGDTV